jgi:hypothetical protein
MTTTMTTTTTKITTTTIQVGLGCFLTKSNICHVFQQQQHPPQQQQRQQLQPGKDQPDMPDTTHPRLFPAMTSKR